MAQKSKPAESKAESLTMRLSPRLKYGLEVIARSQRRSLNSVCEWLFTEGMRSQSITSDHGNTRPIAHVIDELWDPFESDRLVKMATKYPTLLTYEEQFIWKVIKEEPVFWKAHKKPAKLSHKEFGDLLESALEGKGSKLMEPQMRHIRAQWDNIQAAAKGESIDFSKEPMEGDDGA